MMRHKTLILGAAAVLGAIGLTGAAAAAIQNSHVLTVQLPGGATAHIQYFGDTPPEVRLEPAKPFASAAWSDPFAGAFDSGFPAMDRVMAEMEHQADLMLVQAQQLASAAPKADGLMRADLGALPPGVTGYSFVSTVSGRGDCTRTVEYRATGDVPPQVVSRTSGDCGAGKAPSAATSTGGQPAPRLTSVAYRRAA